MLAATSNCLGILLLRTALFVGDIVSASGEQW
ncbi:hypothetical protein N175_08895 [Vibrio anguillarum M3]|nr:hypothetical protein N175_08895 [Vibrio anguillarum M3]